MTAQLLPFQQEAAAFLLARTRAILADHPAGVGKSYPAIQAALTLPPPRIIVCPVFLIPQWRWYLAEEFGQEKVAYFSYGDLAVEGHDAKNAEWLIAGFHAFSQRDRATKELKHHDTLCRHWEVMIVDEAHRLGRQAGWTKEVRRLKAGRLWMLTSTPYRTNAGDVWPLLNICDRKKFPSYWRFVDDVCLVQTNPWRKNIIGVKNPDLLHKMLEPYMLAREFEIPCEVTGSVVPVYLPAEVLRAHNILRRDYSIEFEGKQISFASAGAAIAGLRKFTARDPRKLNTLHTILGEHKDEHIIVFTWYRESAEIVHESLINRPGAAVLVHGGVKAEDRIAEVEFCKKQNCSILTATIESMKEGLNLQHVSVVIFYEHHWVPSTNDQAAARSIRRGQDKHVKVYSLFAAKTIDERVLKIARTRDELVRSQLLREFFA